MQVRIITRDISGFPHRDLEKIPLNTDCSVWWGDKKVPQGYVTMLDLGEQQLDFCGGLELESLSADRYDIERRAEPPPLSTIPRPTRRKTSRRKKSRSKKARGKKAARRKTTQAAAQPES
jgi:hypothetical protein